MNILFILVILKNGNYMPPLDHGYSIEMKEKSVIHILFQMENIGDKIHEIKR